MYRVIVIALIAGPLTALAAGCHRPNPPVTPDAGSQVIAPSTVPPTDPVVVPPQAAQVLTAKQLAGKTFLYNHQLLDGNLDGSSAVLGADGRLTGTGEQTTWRVDAGVLLFLDANNAVRTRFDKVYSGPAGVFLLGHRTGDNRYHTLLELPPTK